jgi:hypothetical protein
MCTRDCTWVIERSKQTRDAPQVLIAIAIVSQRRGAFREGAVCSGGFA